MGNFPRIAPRRIDPEVAALGTAVARRLPWPWPTTLAFGDRPIRATATRIGAVAFDPEGAVAVVRGTAEPILVIGAGSLVRDLAQAVLGGPAELPAARAPTVVEQAVWALAVASALATTDAGAAPGLTAEPSRIAPPVVRAAATVELAVTIGEVAGTAWIAIPGALLERPPTPSPLAALVGARGTWLDAVAVAAPVVIARAALLPAEIDRLAVRDAIVVGAVGGPGEAAIAVAHGALPVAIDRDPDRVTVRAPYQRGGMDETLGEDLTVELAVTAGTVQLSARRLLELAPGEVVPLGRPAGDAVELVVGKRVIGRGELLDVDGELAVRVVSLAPR